MTKRVTAAFLVIGNEILSGKTQDLNMNFAAKELTKIGVNMDEARVVRDDEEEIIKAVNELRAKYDYVFTSGGIGPTHDDITALSVAKAFGVKLIRDERAVKLLEEHYPPEKRNDARMKMADIPEGADLLNNPVSSAPGFKIENVFVMAGVPKIMQSMFAACKEYLVGGDPVHAHLVSSYVTEGNIASELSDLQDSYPDIEIGSYPFIKNERLGTSLVFRSTSKEQNEKAANELKVILDAKDAEIVEEVK